MPVNSLLIFITSKKHTTVFQFGERVYTLSQSVDRFNLKQGNDKARFFLRMLLFAEWAWKDIFEETTWSVTQAALQVCNGKVTLPDNCKQLLSVCIVDNCKRIIGLTYNPNISTLDMKCVQTKCSCKTCHGEQTLCAINDNLTVTTELVNIQGTDYTKTIYTRITAQGDIQTDEHTPVWDVETSAVIYQDIESTVGTVEVSDKGCIINNPKNVDTLKQCCHVSWDMFGWWHNNATKELSPADYNYFGHWNWNAATNTMIDVFGKIDKVLVTYRVDAEKGLSEMVIPQRAEMALHTGMIYQQMLFDPRDRDRNGAGANLYRREKTDLLRYLSPVRIDDILKLQTRKRLW